MVQKFGADRGLLLALTMRRFQIKPGTAVFVETGVPHCYLSGLGVEILSSSDNVLRGGLTTKHVSAADFMAMLDISASLESEPSTSTMLLRGLDRYNFDTSDFALHRVDVSSSNLLVDFGLPSESLLLCVDGELAVSNSLDERLVLRRGEAAYLSGDANFYSISGSGSGYLGSGATS
jgi:mannose-6-phosphate isomerase